MIIFPQTTEEFSIIYANEGRVEVTMTDVNDRPGNDWIQYAIRSTEVDGEQKEFAMWFRSVEE